MKSHSDLSQSKKLIKTLPAETADSYYCYHDERYYIVHKECPYPFTLREKVPCWSLSALLSLFPSISLDYDGKVWTGVINIEPGSTMTSTGNDPVDVCCNLIEMKA